MFYSLLPKNKVKAPTPGDLKYLQGKGLWSVEQV